MQFTEQRKEDGGHGLSHASYPQSVWGVGNASRHRCEVQEKKGCGASDLKERPSQGSFITVRLVAQAAKARWSEHPHAIAHRRRMPLWRSSEWDRGWREPEQPKTPRLVNDRRLSLPAFALVPDHAWRADSRTNYDALRIARQQPPSSTHRVCVMQSQFFPVITQ